MTSESIRTSDKIADLSYKTDRYEVEAMTGIDYGTDGDGIEESAWNQWAANGWTVEQAVADERATCESLVDERGEA